MKYRIKRIVIASIPFHTDNDNLLALLNFQIAHFKEK